MDQHNIDLSMFDRDQKQFCSVVEDVKSDVDVVNVAEDISSADVQEPTNIEVLDILFRQDTKAETHTTLFDVSNNGDNIKTRKRDNTHLEDADFIADEEGHSSSSQYSESESQSTTYTFKPMQSSTRQLKFKMIGTFVDLTEHLDKTQAEVAHSLGIPVSTLSKRWKCATKTRTWPYRALVAINSKIAECKYDGPKLQKLHEERKKLLRPAKINIGPDIARGRILNIVEDE